MTDQPSNLEKAPRDAKRSYRRSASAAAPAAQDKAQVTLCWPFPVGSQNDTDKAVKLKPYVPPKRRTLNQY
jgi:hypothetical protein